MLRWSPLFGVLAALFLSGCGPKYPNCNKDKDCEKKKAGEVCVNQKCVQCKDDTNCPKGQSCSSGTCQAITGFCESKNDCGQGELCESNKCTPGCEVNADCKAGEKCQKNECVAEGKCSTDADCIAGQKCDGSRCVTSTASTGSCTLQNIFFDFDSDEIKGENAKILSANAECANTKDNASKKIVIKGYTDPRGTEEYNLSLGDRRAQVVRDYMTRLGLDPARVRIFSVGAEFAVGGDESGWQKDRRAEISFE
jgi:peptidoglycan-associated lipoprotein